MEKETNVLDKRHSIEEEFHDEKIKHGKEKKTTKLGHANYAAEKLIEALGDYQNKRILEFGCGSDGIAIYLGKRGAIADGFDISGECVLQSERKIRELGLEDRVKIKKMSAEYLEYESNAFDVVLGNAVLHHCDLPLTLKGIRRVLKKGGSAYFLEPLNHNILLKIYRALTPGERSSTEKPLRFSDFPLFENIFEEFEHEEMFFLSLICFVFYAIIPNVKIFDRTFGLLNKIDVLLLKKLPFLKKYCWVVLLKFK
jgi:ubiquinone/menaquinone biosynthesis C-methylase UbiE